MGDKMVSGLLFPIDLVVFTIRLSYPPPTYIHMDNIALFSLGGFKLGWFGERGWKSRRWSLLFLCCLRSGATPKYLTHAFYNCFINMKILILFQ